jgi:hypothetical protein
MAHLLLLFLFSLSYANLRSPEVELDLFCDMCTDSVNAVKEKLDCNGCVLDTLVAITKVACLFYEEPEVCSGMTEMWLEVLFNSLYVRYTNPDIICA